MSGAIAIVGLGCRYADARTPDELWHNALAGRRAFRAIPERRLRLEDYAPGRGDDVDSTYVKHAALVEDFEIDRRQFKISGATFRATDLTHWLALDVADRALRDAGFEHGAGLPRETTGVVVGNSLTGEMSRASALRLRWPYVQRVLAPALAAAGIDADRAAGAIAAAKAEFKRPLAPSDEDSLAGGLSNTIAGRICNVFDLGGGGFTVDGACSSSLLAVAQACSALTAGDLDAALAGGVDISLDPFELVGFARLGALARGEMRIYDANPTGFLPGEGAGFVVLVRYADAIARGLRIHAVIRGWGVASDGSGGITRPRVEGHQAALARCYRRAGFGIETVPLFEGHGTGTAVGDEAELGAIGGALRAGGAGRAAAIGSIKAQLGHTKAAAGVAGLLKATAAVRERIIPPTIGVSDPHPELGRPDAVLRAVAAPEPWPAEAAVRAGVSAIGFGGINVHLCVEGHEPPPAEQRRRSAAAAPRLAASRQDVELLVLDADSPGELAARASQLAARVAAASLAELGDLAAALAGRAGTGRARAAIIAATPEEARSGLEEIARLAAAGEERHDPVRGRFVARRERAPRVGLLFTGQAAPMPVDGGALCRRFPAAARIWELVPPRVGEDRVDTRDAQPAIVAAALAAARTLEGCGLAGDVAVGHSLGELGALAWAGCFRPEEVVRLAAIRGRAMAEACTTAGAMLALAATAGEAHEMIAGTGAAIAAYNGPALTVVSGAREAIEEIARRAAARGIGAMRLATSHAFHSPLMSAAAPPLRAALEAIRPGRVIRTVVSTVTGRRYDDGADGTNAIETLVAQLVSPVRFTDAMSELGAVDLLVEVGPGQILTTLAAALTTAPCVAIDACGSSLRGIFTALGAAWTLGAPVAVGELFGDRWCKPVDLEAPPRLFANPCEAAPAVTLPAPAPAAMTPAAVPAIVPAAAAASSVSASSVLVRDVDRFLEAIRAHVAETTELPLDAIADDARLLEDLHLSSITVAQLVSRAARALGVTSPKPMTGWARATVAEIARAFADDVRPAEATPSAPPPAATWVRAFAVVEDECPPPALVRTERAPWRWHGGSSGLRTVFANLLEGIGGGAVAVVSGSTHDQVDALLAAARDGGDPLVIIDPNRIAGGFGRTIHLESGRAVCVVSYDTLVPAPVRDAIRVEAAGLTAGFRAVHIGEDGRLRTPALEVTALSAHDELDLGPRDVVLVIGGGKGIAAECALALGERRGCRVITVGRGAAPDDAVLAANLRRFAARGVEVTHVSVDVLDADAVQTRLAPAIAAIGPVTAIVHAAAINEPCALAALAAEHVHRTIAPKLEGLDNVLEVVDPARLRTIVAFGSVIARTGLPGEAHYALANDLLRVHMAALQTELPGCRCLVLEWSAWAEVGMAERIGRLDALIQRGLSPISIERGVDAFLRALGMQGAIVIASRLGDAGIARYRPRELPLARFLERPVVHVPGVELVSEVELAPTVDLYLDDHVLDGARVMPAVLQIEAACQVVAALADRPDWQLDEIRFPRAILVDDQGVQIRIAACAHEDGTAEVVVTASDDRHASERMRARLSRGTAAATRAEPPAPGAALAPPYRALLPQRGRFERITGYREIASRRCRFDVSTSGLAGWFARHMAPELQVADPGARDALLHGIQVAVPHRRLVPVAARGVRLARTWPVGSVVVEGRELACTDGEYTWELIAKDGEGTELERWSEVTFRALGPRTAIPRVVVEAWLERRVEELVPSSRLVRAELHHRPDGRPELGASTEEVSASDTADIRLAVAAREHIACDLELVAIRPVEVWHDLLGESAQLASSIATRLAEPYDRAATRVWSALECCAKLGVPDARLLLVSAEDDAVRLRHGDIEIASCAVTVTDRGELVVAIATAPRIAAATRLEAAS